MVTSSLKVNKHTAYPNTYNIYNNCKGFKTKVSIKFYIDQEENTFCYLFL